MTAHTRTTTVLDRDELEDFGRRWLAAWNTRQERVMVRLQRLGARLCGVEVSR
jgi:hypothetical protein